MAIALFLSIEEWEPAQTLSATCLASPTSCRGRMGRGDDRASLQEWIPSPSLSMGGNGCPRTTYMAYPTLVEGVGQPPMSALAGGHDVYIMQHFME